MVCKFKKLKFNSKGIEDFTRQIYMRPIRFERIEDDVYLFKCSEVQAINYFFKFGKNIEILEPISLREKFINRYSKALQVYKDK